MYEKLKPKGSKLQPEFKIANFNHSEKPFDLRTVDTNILVNMLEEKIKLREMSLQHQLKKKVLR